MQWRKEEGWRGREGRREREGGREGCRKGWKGEWAHNYFAYLFLLGAVATSPINTLYIQQYGLVLECVYISETWSYSPCWSVVTYIRHQCVSFMASLSTRFTYPYNQIEGGNALFSPLQEV